jgi:hypothetical protein
MKGSIYLDEDGSIYLSDIAHAAFLGSTNHENGLEVLIFFICMACIGCFKEKRALGVFLLW